MHGFIDVWCRWGNGEYVFLIRLGECDSLVGVCRSCDILVYSFVALRRCTPGKAVWKDTRKRGIKGLR